MNIDELTLGQIKQLQGLLGGDNKSASDLYQRYVGKYVICRTRNEGINAGVVIAADDTGVILQDARRLWYHKPKTTNCSWYEGIARDGISYDTKCGVAREKLIVEDYSLTICSEAAEKTIREAKDHVQN
jgi:hypothetical protein